MEAKTCKQCGQLKPLTQFRKYYGNRTGRYTICLQCEKINSRLKYLERKETLAAAEVEEVDKIYKLYEVQRSVGLQPPRQNDGRKQPIVDSLDDMLAMYSNRKGIMTTGHAGALQELQEWLDKPLTEEPDYYIDEVYERLTEKWRPVLRIDKDTMLPVYDDTYTATLTQILDRFYAYEDDYNEG